MVRGGERPRNTNYLEWTGVPAAHKFAPEMRLGARTPEELESLLEDAFVMHDVEALCEMFEDGGVLVAGVGHAGARGTRQIRRLATALWESDHGYIAEPHRVVQARGAALVVGRSGISVARRRGDGDWRYEIALLASEDLDDVEVGVDGTRAVAGNGAGAHDQRPADRDV